MLLVGKYVEWNGGSQFSLQDVASFPPAVREAPGPAYAHPTFAEILALIVQSPRPCNLRFPDD